MSQNDDRLSAAGGDPAARTSEEADACTGLDLSKAFVVSTEPDVSATVVHLDGSTLVVLMGELDMETVSDLSATLEPLVRSGPSDVVVDISRLGFVDSSGIAAFVSAQNRLEEQGRRLVLTSPQPAVAKVFEITGLRGFLNIAAEFSPALESQEPPGSNSLD